MCVCVCVYVYIYKPGGIYFAWILRSTFFVKPALELLEMLGMVTVRGRYLIFSDVRKRQVKSSFIYLLSRALEIASIFFSFFHCWCQLIAVAFRYCAQIKLGDRCVIEMLT